ncbi:gamma-butyrobetaine hydroxylase-like domain-containing protein [Pseudomonas sp. RP23018S]|uniref:DUF971 domain-containing protein n=1 Tax=Pseudomonas sp. RP23018S TaxID=3096037 RepID=UPI002ACAF681|nr:gamma-butyrobetaine hydroxylase-like domain-containing protein [Pseudomonas sp. RP23018S]MDZ5604881.1 gamma-butyrobetaine hydroxylase-like domain-containing protein [Pseudomonas sp. RP23018S]
MSLVPTALRNARDEGWLVIEWDRPHVFSHAQLRQACPCSHCRAARLRGQGAAVRGRVRLERIELQGYGVQMIFSDGHDRGIYPWAYLHGLLETLGAETDRA